LAQSFIKSGDETLEGLVKNKIQMKRWSEISKRGIQEQKIIVADKSEFCGRRQKKGEEKMQMLLPPLPHPSYY
jgi:hypothetical protein